MKTIVRMVDVPINDWNNQTKGTVTLEIADGEFVLLQGPNGSGKSYLLNLMAALRVPSVGEVFLEGKRLTTMRERQKRAWRAGLGLIPSEPVLLNGYTVLVSHIRIIILHMYLLKYLKRYQSHAIPKNLY